MPRDAMGGSSRLVRRHLVQVLDRPVPLTVVRGPSGFGKSTLVRQWADQAAAAGTSVHWCEPSVPSDPCAAMLAALRGDEAASSSEVWRSVEDQETPTVLVVDGLDEAVGADVGRLLRIPGRPDNFRVIVTTRVRDAAEELAALTLGAVVISPDELRFAPADIAELAAQRGVPMTSEEAELVEREVGGWPILVDAVLTRLGGAPDGAPLEVAGAAAAAQEGLWSQVLRSELAQRDVDLLAQLSVAEHLTGEVAAYLTGDARIQHALTHLEAAGVLSTDVVASGETVYRIPRALRRIVTDHASAPIDRGALSADLARHLVDGGRPAMAVLQAHATQDRELVAEILEDSWVSLWGGHDPEVLQALVALPADVVARYPRVQAAQRIVTGARVGREALPLPPTRSAAELRQMARVIGLSNALETSVLETIVLRRSGHFSDALAMARTVAGFADIADEDTLARLRPVHSLGRYELALAAMLAGDDAMASEQLHDAYRWIDWLAPRLDAQRRMIDALGALKSAVAGDLLAADVRSARRRGAEPRQQQLLVPYDHSSAGRIAEAIVAVDRLDRESAQAALSCLTVQDRVDELWAYAAWTRARFGLLWGDRRGALRGLDKAKRLNRHLQDGGGIARPLLAAAGADLLLADGRANRAAALLATAPAHPFVDVARARLALAIGDDETAMLASLKVVHDDLALDRVCLEAKLIRAASTTRALGVDHGVRWWKDAAALASRLGSPLAAFAMVPADLIASAEPHVPELRAVLRELSAAGVRPTMPEQAEVVELSQRQQSVLDALARGMTIPMIARSHFVSPNTIKSQLRALYARLGAHSREEAVAIARDWGLIDD